MKENIMKNIIALLQAGYEIRLRKQSIQVIETYKSQSRMKWHEKEVAGSIGSFDYWTDGALRIIAGKLQEYRKELLVPKLSCK